MIRSRPIPWYKRAPSLATLLAILTLLILWAHVPLSWGMR